MDRSGETFRVPVAYAGQNVVAIDCDWATDADAAFDAEAAGRLLTPVDTSRRWPNQADMKALAKHAATTRGSQVTESEISDYLYSYRTS